MTAPLPISILPFHPSLSASFRAINLGWISHFFTVEPHDEATLADPAALIAAGGHILFAMDASAVASWEATPCAAGEDDPRVLGCLALLTPPAAGGVGMELAKMGVREAARGRGVGRALGEAAVALALAQGVLRLDILSNRRLEPALALYRSLGFVEAPMPPTDYARADIYLVLELPPQPLLSSAAALPPPPATSDALTPAQLEAVSRLRASLAPQLQLASPRAAAYVDEAALVRVLVAREWSVAAATSAMTATLAWRASIGVDEVPPSQRRCETCLAVPGSHCIVPIGRTRGGHPVVWGCPARGRSSDGPSTVAHIIATLEHVLSQPLSAAQWCWTVDFSHFSWREATQVSIALGFARVLPHHYPERLYRIVMINPPSLFGMLMKVMRPWLDARTLSKLVARHGAPDDVQRALTADHGFSEEMAVWVAEAMRMPPGLRAESVPPLPAGAAPLQLPGGG